MDELELLKEMRAGLPPARPEARARARLLLLARAEGHEHPEKGGRAAVLRRGRSGLIAAGLAVALVLLLAAGGLIGAFGGGSRVTAATAAQVLRQTARIAAGRRPITPGPGQYLYTRSRSAYLTTFGPSCPRRTCGGDANTAWSVLVPKEIESWISVDGSRKGRIREVSGSPRFLSAYQRAAWVAAGSPSLPKPGATQSTASGAGRVVAASDLPRMPAVLRRKIEARRIPGVEGPPGRAETFVLIGDLLRASYLPAVERSALLEAAAELPGVESLGEVEDRVGRRGVGVAFTDRRQAIRHELILDPQTSALLGERDTTTRTRYAGMEIPVGTTIGWTAYLEAKVVDSVGRGAPAGAGSFDDSVGCYESPSLHGAVAILHGRDPLATCQRLWHEGALGTRLRRLEGEGKIKPDPGRYSPTLVACTDDGTPALVFPKAGRALCVRLGLEPLDLAGWRRGE